MNPYELAPDRVARELAWLRAQRRRDRQRAAARQLAAQVVAGDRRGVARRLAQEVERLNHELDAQIRRTAEAVASGAREARRRGVIARVLGR